MSEISIHDETGAIATNVVLMFLSLFLIVLGTWFQTKIIMISKREKEMTWKHDITNSVFLIFHYAHAWLFHTLTYFISDLHNYVGKWYCYTYRILAYYGNIYTVGHSLSICAMKYILIVHWEKARNYEDTIELRTCFSCWTLFTLWSITEFTSSYIPNSSWFMME